MLASEDFRTAEGEPLPYDKHVPARERHHPSRRPYTPAGGARRRPAPGTAAGRRRLPRVQRRPRRQPQRRQGQPDLGAQARTARSRRSDLRARQLQDHARDDPGADPAAVGRLPHDHRRRARPAQPRLPAAVQQRDADLVPGPGREPRGGARWWSRSRSATSSTASLHAGAGVSTDQKPPATSCAARSASTCAAATRTETSGATAGAPPPTSPTARRCCAAISAFLDRRFLGTLFRFDISLNYLQQETVRLGDIRSGAGSIGFSREMYPGVDAGIHYNLRNTTHTEPLIRVAGPDETIGSVRLGTTVGSLSANVEWLRMDNRLVPTRGFRVNALAELALPALSAPLRPFPLDVGDDTFLKVSVRSLSVIPIGAVLLPAPRLPFRAGVSAGRRVAAAQGRALLRGRRHDHPRLPARSRAHRGGSLSATRRSRPADVYQRRIPAAGRQPPHPAEHRPACSRSARPGTGRVFFDNGVVADSLDGLSLPRSATASASRRCCIRLPDRRRQPGLGLAARSRPGRHPDRRLPRQRRRCIVSSRSSGGCLLSVSRAWRGDRCVARRSRGRARWARASGSGAARGRRRQVRTAARTPAQARGRRSGRTESTRIASR